ncbi:WD40 repeat-like protein [Leucogyrophana mollusca]|uniref:WD40 repeat-like protein n=1 Tax=Leucogyrophana mollusca TaxID=85980 RepID=A0ACB8B131_9AGAM|nr:WD40 repeat-like protein [Leucogyrophana mollusca]
MSESSQVIERGTSSTWIFEGHDGAVDSIAFSPDGLQVATSSSDKSIRLWDIHSGQASTVPLKGHTAAVSSLAFSPGDGALLASAAGEDTVYIWDISSGRIILEPAEAREQADLLYGVSSVTFLANESGGLRLAGASSRGTVLVWNVETGQIIAGPFGYNYNNVYAIEFSPNGMNFASWGHDRIVRIWDTLSGELVATASVEGKAWLNLCMAWSPQCDHVATVNYDGFVEIWRRQDDQIKAGSSLSDNTLDVRSIAFSFDGRTIVVGTREGTIHVWDSLTGERLGLILEGHSGPVGCISVAPGGDWIASGSADRKVRIWDATQLRSPQRDITEPPASKAHTSQGIPTSKHPHKRPPVGDLSAATDSFLDLPATGIPYDQNAGRGRDENSAIAEVERASFWDSASSLHNQPPNEGPPPTPPPTSTRVEPTKMAPGGAPGGAGRLWARLGLRRDRGNDIEMKPRNMKKQTAPLVVDVAAGRADERVYAANRKSKRPPRRIVREEAGEGASKSSSSSSEGTDPGWIGVCCYCLCFRR